MKKQLSLKSLVHPKLLNKIADLVMAGSAVLLIFAIVSHITIKPSDKPSRLKTGLTERDAVVSKAKENGEKTYKFETQYTPGVGVIANPEEYKQKFEENYKDFDKQ